MNKDARYQVLDNLAHVGVQDLIHHKNNFASYCKQEFHTAFFFSF